MLEFNQSQWLKPYVKIQYTKKNRCTKKNGDNDRKAMQKLMNNAVCGKTMRNT